VVRGSGRAVTPSLRTGIVLLVGGVLSVQFGSALAATLFPIVGPAGAVGLRFAFAAVLVVLMQRRWPSSRRRADLALVATLGVAMALMVLLLYQAIDRMPLGVVITFEFLGPLAVAIALSRRWRDLGLALLALVGVLVLTGTLEGAQLVGVLFALGAAASWAAYIGCQSLLAGRRVSGALPLATTVAALLVAPWSLWHAGSALLDLRVVLVGLLVAVLSSVVWYAADMLALRVVPPRVFGVMMSLHPAGAAIAGFVVLGEVLSVRQLAGMLLVVLASALAAWLASRPSDEVLAAEGASC
jgi:inner membrane transporter RhtA